MQRIGYIAAPDFHFMSLAALSVFEIANRTAPKRLHDVRLLSEAGGLLTNSIGMSIDTHPFDTTSFDTIIVGGGLGIVEATRPLVAFIQNAQKKTRRIASACSARLFSQKRDCSITAEPPHTSSTRANSKDAIRKCEWRKTGSSSPTVDLDIGGRQRRCRSGTWNGRAGSGR